MKSHSRFPTLAANVADYFPDAESDAALWALIALAPSKPIGEKKPSKVRKKPVIKFAPKGK